MEEFGNGLSHCQHSVQGYRGLLKTDSLVYVGNEQCMQLIWHLSLWLRKWVEEVHLGPLADVGNAELLAALVCILYGSALAVGRVTLGWDRRIYIRKSVVEWKAGRCLPFHSCHIFFCPRQSSQHLLLHRRYVPLRICYASSQSEGIGRQRSMVLPKMSSGSYFASI